MSNIQELPRNHQLLLVHVKKCSPVITVEPIIYVHFYFNDGIVPVEFYNNLKKWELTQQGFAALAKHLSFK